MCPTFGSLFSGIGGIDLGLERAGMRCMWQVENDNYAQRVLAKHWPDVPRFGDVRNVGAHNLAYADVIAGGFPCQDISNAGRGAGLAGERSGLWFEFARVVRELRPRYVLVENVAALLGRGIDTVLGDLAACGYDAEWQCISATAVGAPHLRERIFIVAYTKCESRKLRFDASEVWGWQEEAKQARMGRGRVFAAPAVSQWATESDVGRVADGVPNGLDRLRGLGNAVVPQVAEYVGRCIIQHNRGEPWN